MSGSAAQGTPPPYAPPAPAPAAAPPPMWAPAGGSYLPNMRHDPWGMISFASRAIGFLLIFIAALVFVAAVSIPGSCYTAPTSCGDTWLSNLATATLIARLIAVLGLAALGFGAAVKLHYGIRQTSATTAEEAQIIASERRVEGALFIASVVLLILVALTVNAFPALPTGGL